MLILKESKLQKRYLLVITEILFVRCEWFFKHMLSHCISNDLIVCSHWSHLAGIYVCKVSAVILCITE